MQNQMNMQALPNQAYYNQYSAPVGQTSPYVQQPYYQPQCYPSSGVGAVNIQIYSPTANPAQTQGFYQPVPCQPYPCNYNNLINTQTQPQAPAAPAPTNTNPGQIDPTMNQTMNVNNNQNGVAAQGEGEEGKKTEEKKKEEKPKVALTDDYIKTLENYLNSQDKKIRLMGAKELFERFKEDETRKDDAALTALLNKVIQDPAETVKFIGLTALDTGYATGNDETAQILAQMQSSDSSYGEDAALASRILLKMSGYKANADAAALQNGAQNPAQSANSTTGANVALQNTNTATNAASPAPQDSQTPNLAQTQGEMGAVDKMPPVSDGTLLTPQNGASMNQTMEINPNGKTTMNQSMVPPLENGGNK